jgi:hypothetical protein
MATKTKTAKADVLDLIPEDEQKIISIDGGVVLDWLKRASAFFTQARELQAQAVQTLSTAKGLVVPTTAESDATLQKFIQRTTADKKAIEAHWSICSAVHRIHRQLTAKREIGVRALDEANAIGNRLHNEYVAVERRKAEAEERRLREQAEFLARQEREQELARAEAEAVEREEASPELSARETEFVNLFTGINTLYKGRGQACAVAASYSDPLKASARLLSNPKIQQAIRVRQEAAEMRRQAAVRAAEPLIVDTPEVRPNVIKAPGAFDRTTVSGVVVDEAAVMEAFLSGRYGLPRNLWTINQTVVNELARQMGQRLDTIPGLRFKSTTKVI